MTSVVALRLTTPRVVKLSLKRPATAHRPTVRPTLALPNPAPYPHSMEAVHLPSTDGTPSWGFLLMQDIEDGFSDLECLTDVEEVMELSNLAKAASMARPLGYTPLPYEMPHSMEDVESGLTDWEDFAEFAEGQQA